MRKLLIGVIALLMLVMTVGSAMAINIVKPAPGSRDVCGTYNFSATIETPGSVANVTFFWNNSGSYTRLCTVTNTSTTPKLFLNESFSCSASTTVITDGAGSIWVAGYDVETAGTVAEENLSAVLEFDNSGPVITFDGTSTADKAKLAKSSDFDIRITSSEVSTADGYVKINGKMYPLVGELLTWTYDFTEYDIPDGEYTYQVFPGADNTTCATTGSAQISRTVNIGKPSSAKVAAITAEQTASDAASALVSKASGSRNVLILAGVAVAVYVLFFHKKKGRR